VQQSHVGDDVRTYVVGDDVRTYVVGLCEVCSSTDSGGDDVR